MTLTEVVETVAAVALGVFAGWLLERSRFNFDRVFRAPLGGGPREWLRAWGLAIGLSWLAVGAAQFNGWLGVQRMPETGLPAAAVAGFVSGLCIGLLGQDPLSIWAGAGRTSLWALIALGGWLSGLVFGLHSPLGLALEKFRAFTVMDIGSKYLSDLVVLPQWMILLVAGAALLFRMMRVPVDVGPGKMEWPKQGLGLAVLVAAGWTLALRGGNFGGLNMVEAADDLWIAATSGLLQLKPALLVGLGMAGWGLVRALSSGRIFPDPVGNAAGVFLLLGASFLLGLANALGMGCPLARAFFGLSVLQNSSIVYTACMAGGLALIGIIGRNARAKEA